MVKDKNGKGQKGQMTKRPNDKKVKIQKGQQIKMSKEKKCQKNVKRKKAE
jgi:hypothetical protein